jgi:hypothetical protein
MIKVSNNIQQMLEKQASLSDNLDYLMDLPTRPSNLPITMGLAGAGLGAGGGALYELLSGKKDKNYLRSILAGAGIGGLAGAGGGMLAKERSLSKARKNMDLQDIREQESKDKSVDTMKEPASGAIMRTPMDPLEEALMRMGIDLNKKPGVNIE